MKKILSILSVVAIIAITNSPKQTAIAGNRSYSYNSAASGYIGSTYYYNFVCNQSGSQCSSGSSAMVAEGNLTQYAQGIIAQEL